MTSTADGLRLQHFSLHTALFQSALDSLRSELDEYIDLSRSLVGQTDCLDSNLTTLATPARESRSSFRRGVKLLFESFCASVEQNDDPKDPFSPTSIR